MATTNFYLTPSYIKIEFNELNSDIQQNIKNFLYEYFKVEKKDKFVSKTSNFFMKKKEYIEFYDSKYDLLPIGFLNNLVKLFQEKILQKFNIEIKPKIIDLRDRKKIEVDEDKKIVKVCNKNSETIYNLEELFNEKYKLRDYQEKAVLYFFKNADCLGMYEGSVASGKTLVFASICKILDEPTLIIVDRKDLAHQGRQEFIKEYKFNIKDVGIIQGNNILEKKINFVTIQSIKKISDLNKYKLLIIDECHNASAPSFQQLLMTSQSVYRLGVSGTISGLETEDFLKLKAFLGDIYYQVPTKDLIEQKILAKPKLYLYEINKPIINQWEYGNNWFKIENDLIVNNNYRNQKIAEIVKNLPLPSLILITKIEHGYNLKKLIPNSYFLYGKTDEEIRNIFRNKINRGDQIVVITTNIWNKGINLKMLKSLVIAGAMKSFVLTKQRAGRGLRRVEGLKEDIIIVDFMDKTHKILEKQSQKRLKIYVKDGFEIIKV